MRIAFLLQDASGIYGAERATLDLAAALQAESGLEVRILLIRESRLHLQQSPLEQGFLERNLVCHPLETASPFSWKLVRQIRTVLTAEQADVLHTVDTKSVVHGWLAAGRGRRLPVCGTVHGWLFRKNFKERFYQWLEIQCLKRYSRVVVLSRYYENYLLGHQVPRQKLVRIPSGLPVADLPQAAPHRGGFPDGLTVGLMGRLSAEKNIPMLLRAAARLTDQDIRVIIAGEGPDRKELEDQVAREGLGARVTLTGYLPREDFFKQVDLIVLCSKIENLPYTVLEAMAVGMPVVAARVGGLPDLIVDGETGFLVDPDDDAALADRIMQIASGSAPLAEMGRAARHKLEQEFGLGQGVDSYRALYREMVK